MGCTDFTNQPFAGIAFTIIFFIAIGIDDWLWGQWDDLTHIRMKHYGLQDLMRIAHFAFCALVGQTTWAIDFSEEKYCEPSIAIR